MMMINSIFSSFRCCTSKGWITEKIGFN